MRRVASTYELSRRITGAIASIPTRRSSAPVGVIGSRESRIPFACTE